MYTFMNVVYLKYIFVALSNNEIEHLNIFSSQKFEVINLIQPQNISNM